MIVTDIAEQSASKVKIEIDGAFAFVLYKGELRKYGIKSGEPIPDAVYEELTVRVLPKRATLRCMNLLKSRDYTVAQLKTKLKQGGYPEAAMESAIAYVASYGYVDDLRYAEEFIRCSQETKSRRRIDCDLQRKGISPDTVKQAWENWQKQGNAQDEEEQIRRLLAKKHYDGEHADRKETQKIYAFLARRGFDLENIRKVLFTST